MDAVPAGHRRAAPASSPTACWAESPRCSPTTASTSTPTRSTALFNPDLAGGALLDLGVYPVSFTSFVLQNPSLASPLAESRPRPAWTASSAPFSPTTTAPRRCVNHALAQTPTTGRDRGECGPRRTDRPVLRADRADGHGQGRQRALSLDGGPIRGHKGLAYEAAHLASLIRSGASESPLLPWAETLSIMQTMDEMRRQIDFKLPGE